MMARLIDADALRQDWLENGENEYVYDTNAFLKSIDEAPTIEAEPVRHGRWEHGYNNGQYGIWCSECRAGFAYSDNYEVIAASHNYCPNYGAKKDKEDE
jgi:hypothetical protein